MTPIDISKFEQLKASGDLPSPKGVALCIMDLARRDDVSLAEMARVIKTDPAFVGRLVKAANGINVLGVGKRPVVSIQDALAVLGLPAVRALALSFSLLSDYASGQCRNFDYRTYWSHSLAMALAMQALTAHTRAAAPEETFSVGLLARIGELALATLYPEAYSNLLVKDGHLSLERLVSQERSALAMDHRELAAAMLGDWGLPKVYTEPVFFHETPDDTAFPGGSRLFILTQSLGLARAIAEVCISNDAQRGSLTGRLLLLGSRLSIEEDALGALCDRVARDWQEWGALLNVATRPVPAFKQIPRILPDEEGDKQSPISSSDRQRIRVLIVDDDPALRAMLRAALQKIGNEVIEAADGREALELALEKQPHMMVVDWVMPEMDGMQLTRALRQTKVGHGMFIMVLTSFEDDERLVEAFETGVDDFMHKPLRPRVLTARLRAGQRIIKLQHEIERDREEIRHFAAELAVTNRRLQEVALTDVLTGFPNRRFAMERIQQEWSAAGRSSRPLSCLVIDLDGFKQVNDTYGHDAGDAVLKQTALALKKGLRAQDVICRTGGDEFLVICTDTGLQAALVCAERARRSVEGMPVISGLHRLKGSVSIGVAVREGDMLDADALIKRADQGLYVAKERGRNRVATAQTGP
ncbi:MAG: diguanylate cyclase [Rhodocyclaceae bacterium]